VVACQVQPRAVLIPRLSVFGRITRASGQREPASLGIGRANEPASPHALPMLEQHRQWIRTGFVHQGGTPAFKSVKFCKIALA
jgi:hypothetical protein